MPNRITLSLVVGAIAITACNADEAVPASSGTEATLTPVDVQPTTTASPTDIDPAVSTTDVPLPPSTAVVRPTSTVSNTVAPEQEADTTLPSADAGAGFPDLTPGSLQPVSVLAAGPAPRSSYAVAPDASAVVWAESGRLCIGQVANPTAGTCVDAGLGFRDPRVSWAPDGSRAFATDPDQDGQAVWIFPDGTITPFGTDEQPFFALEHTIDSDGALHALVFGQAGPALLRIDEANGSVALTRLTGLEQQRSFSFAPTDGGYVVSTRSPDSDGYDLWRFDGEDPTFLAHLPDGSGYDVLAVAPDGVLTGSYRRITDFVKSAEQGSEFFDIHPLAGGSSVAVSNQPARIHQAATLSPDGLHVATLSVDPEAQVSDGEVRFFVAIATVASIARGRPEWLELDLPDAPAVTNAIGDHQQVIFWPTADRITLAMSDHVYVVEVAGVE